MLNKSKKNEVSDKWVNNLFSTWIDEEYQISTKAIHLKNWMVIPVIDFINPMEAEWLSESIAEIKLAEIIAISFEYKVSPLIEKLSNNRDAIMKYNIENSHKYIMLTTHGEHFLYYKEQKYPLQK